MQSGVSAWTYTVYSHALKALKGETVQAEMYKNTYDNQILEIGSVYKNRDIDFKLSHRTSNDDSWINSTWQYVDITSSYPNVLQIHGGLFSGHQYIATFAGNKKLTMRTVGIHIGVTGQYGTWWLSETEYNQYKGL